MTSCYQFEDMNMLEHGVSVSREYRQLLRSLESGTCQEEFLQKVYASLKPLLLDERTCERYQVHHDCGKPFSPEEGGRKFHNHAVHSYHQWKLLFPQDVDVAELMLHDMDFHIGCSQELLSSKYAPTLYLTAWAELYANCKMFGGTESISFKIKRKKLVQQGKKLLTHLQKGDAL